MKGVEGMNDSQSEWFQEPIYMYVKRVNSIEKLYAKEFASYFAEYIVHTIDTG